MAAPQPVSHSVCLISEGSALTNGGLNLHSPVKRKLETEKDYVFDKRLRYSVRQNESNCRFRDIVVRKEEGFTHILLSSQTSDNNALTPEVRGAGREGLPCSPRGTAFVPGPLGDGCHMHTLPAAAPVLVTLRSFSV